MKTPLPNSIAAMAPELAEWRRDFHQHPELAYEETRTAGVVAEKLRSFGCDEVATGLGGTGVVGVIRGKGSAASDRAIMLRADMDALPIEEQTGAEHASQTLGKMHACGHDGHTTMLLGAAKHLAETRAFDGTVYVCFQPAEEGGAGAKAMIDDGLFEKFPVSRVFGMHNWPGLPIGEFAVRPGATMASSDEFVITLTGKGGHAAKPEKARDPIVAGAHLVTALQTLVSRRTDPLQPVVLSVTTFHAGSAFNVIPGEAVLSGTVRAFDEAVHEAIHDGIAEMATECERMFGVSATVERPKTCYPPTINDPDATTFVSGVLEDMVGADKVHPEHPPTMGAEDFAFLSREVPGCFVFCGNGDSAPLHNDRYDFDDQALAVGVAYWVRLAEAAL